MLLACLGGMCGVLFAWWSIKVLTAIGAMPFPWLRGIGLNRQVLGFSLLLTICSGFIVGLAPSFHASRTDLSELMNDASRGCSEGLQWRRWRGVPVICEVAISLTLLANAGLLTNSFLRLQHVNPGYRSEDVLTVPLSFLHPKYAGPPTAATNNSIQGPKSTVERFV